MAESDDRAEPDEDASDRFPVEADQEPARLQFGLQAIFALTTACGLYFLLERVFHGQFALHALAAAVLALGLALPTLWFLMWYLRLLSEANEPFGTLFLMLSIAGAALAFLGALFGL